MRTTHLQPTLPHRPARVSLLATVSLLVSPRRPARSKESTRLADHHDRSTRGAATCLAVALVLAQAGAPVLAAGAPDLASVTLAAAPPAVLGGVAPTSAALAPAHPAAQPTFDLGLETALPAPEIAAATPPRAMREGDAELRLDRASALRLPDLHRLSALARQPQPQQTTADSSPGREGGFGRWLKRHWWVPVLVGGAAAWAISESGGDDDRLGEDD
jgi:hypothetical protein